jgi:hypothetical protein
MLYIDGILTSILKNKASHEPLLPSLRLGERLLGGWCSISTLSFSTSKEGSEMMIDLSRYSAHLFLFAYLSLFG